MERVSEGDGVVRRCRDCVWSAAVLNVGGELLTGIVDCHRRPVFEYRWPTDWCGEFERRSDGDPVLVTKVRTTD